MIPMQVLPGLKVFQSILTAGAVANTKMGPDLGAFANALPVLQTPLTLVKCERLLVQYESSEM